MDEVDLRALPGGHLAVSVPSGHLAVATAVGRLTVTLNPAPAPPPAPSIGAVTIDPVANEIVVSGLSEPGTLYLGIDQDPGVTAGPAIKAGVTGGTYLAAATVITVAHTTVTVPIDLGALAPGNHYLHLTLETALGLYSIDSPTLFAYAAPATAPSVRDVQTTAAPSGGSAVIDLPATVGAGDWLVVAVGTYTGHHPAAPPAGWSEAAVIAQPTGINKELTLYQKLADGSEAGATMTLTFTGGWSPANAVAVAIRDATGLGPASVATSGYATTATAPAVPITNAGGLALAAFVQNMALSGADLVATVAGAGFDVALHAVPDPGSSPVIIGATAAGAQYWATASLEAIA